MLRKINFLKIFARKKGKNFSTNLSTYLKEPEEYRTVYIEKLPQDWSVDEIKVRLEQIGPIEKLHIVKNSLGENTGKGKKNYYL
jgi:hypothetical protein